MSFHLHLNKLNKPQSHPRAQAQVSGFGTLSRISLFSQTVVFYSSLIGCNYWIGKGLFLYFVRAPSCPEYIMLQRKLGEYLDYSIRPSLIPLYLCSSLIRKCKHLTVEGVNIHTLLTLPPRPQNQCWEGGCPHIWITGREGVLATLILGAWGNLT